MNTSNQIVDFSKNIRKKILFTSLHAGASSSHFGGSLSTVEIISTLYNTVSGKKITFFGWAFKKDTNDTRETAAIYVADSLIEEKAEITVYDHKVSREQMRSDLNYLGTRSNEEKEKYLKKVDDTD